MTDEIFAMLQSELESWQTSQLNQQDSHAYEQSFVDLWRLLGQRVFQASVGTPPRSRNLKRKIKTSFGVIECRKDHILSEMTHGFRLSRYLQERICYVGQNEVYEEASECLAEFLGVDVSNKEVERVCHCYGELLETQTFESEVESSDQEEPKSDLAYGMVDGSMVLTRESGWKEIKLGRLFKADDLESENRRHSIKDSIYTAHMGHYNDFLPKWRANLNSNIRYVFLADGAKWFWRWADQEHPDAIQILDYYHCDEYLWDFAKVWFKDASQRQSWVEDQETLLFEDQVGQVIANIEQMGKCGAEYTVAKEKILTYFINNQKRMLYGSYKKQGLLIGSGPIESAHRNVIQKRLKLAGQRWTEKGAQWIANLRVCRKSNRWQEIVNLADDYRVAA